MHVIECACLAFRHHPAFEQVLRFSDSLILDCKKVKLTTETRSNTESSVFSLDVLRASVVNSSFGSGPFFDFRWPTHARDSPLE